MSAEATPNLRQLRLIYSHAIAETKATQEWIESQGNCVTGISELARRQNAELAAGRAYMAALDEQDPACRVCGCTEYSPCVACDESSGDEGGVCGWVHKPGEPPLCSSCQVKQSAVTT